MTFDRDRHEEASAPRPDRIELRAMWFEGRHGVRPAEHAEAQPFEVDVVVQTDLAIAGRTDNLVATIDYGRVHELAGQIVGGPHVDLIETLAERIAEAVLDLAPHAAVTVRVRKLRPPLPGPLDWAGVEITRQRA